MTNSIVSIDRGEGPRQVALSDWLTPERAEAASAKALAWIKSLRHADVDGQPFRRRFTFRGDSLWWFAELYLHKQQTVLQIFRTLLALDALIRQERPRTIALIDGDRTDRWLVQEAARTHGITFTGRPPGPFEPWARLAAIDARGTLLHLAALASRLRRRAPFGRPGRPAVVAFVHRAFWRAGVADGSAESYIGPVLRALESRLPAAAVQYVSVGPAENFRARRWWHGLIDGGESAAAPIEQFASLERLAPSRQLWRERHALRRAMWRSADLRARSRIDGCDCWPVVREALAGVALLQWPWSARAMDEAAAALDALGPSAALTYAEAGGWGRAIALECRRRGVPLAGLQHGFIYRHWLNYLHEPDEMVADAGNAADAGFPRPTVTLLYDGYALRHLIDAGRFPPSSLSITGSPRLDELARATRAITAGEVERVRAAEGVAPGDHLVLVAAKHKEAPRALAAAVDAASQLAGVHVVIKTHPAETPDVYTPFAAARAAVTIVPASAPLAPLLRASRAVVTVNSTVALDAAVLGIPALVVGEPNNLTPFVEAGVLAGVGASEMPEAIRRILYDEGFRQQLEARRGEFLARVLMRSDGRAAERAADAVLRLVRTPAPEAASGH